MDPVDGLKGLGLTQYEASVYTTLLGSGPLEAREISKRAGVPSGRIYDALHALSDQGMVEVIGGRPKRFSAIQPSVAFDELLSSKRVELDHAFEEMTREAARLEAELGPKAREEPRPVFKVSVGEETGRAFLATQIARARETIDLSLRFEFKLEPRDVEVFRALSKAVERGVSVRAVLPTAELDRAIESPFAPQILELLGPHLGQGLDVRLSEQAVVPFTVLDGRSVTLAVKNPIEPDRYFAFLYVHDPPFGKDLTRKFEELWEGAEAGVLEALEMAEVAAEAFEP